MAITAPLLYADLAASRAAGSFSFGGIAFDQLALAISTAVGLWAVGQPQNVQLSGTSTGTAGAGTISTLTSRLLIAPNPGIVVGTLVGAGLPGSLGVSLGTVVGTAIPSTFTKSGQYSGVSAGVGTGVDVSKITVANPVTLLPILLGKMISFLGPGPAASMMATGLANGISALLFTGAGVGSVVGSVSSIASIGTTQSVVV